MIKYTCPQCNRTTQLVNIRKRVFCSCGGIAHNPEWVHQQSDRNKTQDEYGPGDAMADIIRDFGISEKQGCSCRSLRQKMNAWGVDGCEQQRDWIVSQLEANAAKWSWLETLQIAASNAVNPLALSLAFRGNIYHALLDEAIQRSRLASKIV